MKDVNTTHRDYDKYLPKWQRARDVLAGQDAVHKAGEKYLPRLTDQDDPDYKSYVKRAGFYNASWRTVAGLLGMMFRKDPTIEVPSAIEPYLRDIDMAGTTIDTFARRAATEVLATGRFGVLVDQPDPGEEQPEFLAQAEARGIRPMLKSYVAESIINWKYGRVNNRYVLVKVVLEEYIDVPDGEFKSEQVTQWRVLDLDLGYYRQRVFRKMKGSEGEFEQIGDDIMPQMNRKPMPTIPLFIFGTDGIETTLDEPPLIDLFDLNLSHYRTNADYEHGCHFTGLPTLFLSGMATEEGAPRFYIGSQAAIMSSHPDADGKFIEFTGQGLGSLKDNLDRKEQQMAVLGARMIAEEKRVAETATTAAIHRTGENSVLASIAMALSDGMTRALKVFAEWARASGEVVFELNRDYNPAMLGAAELTAYLKMVLAGKMSGQSLFDLLQRGDVVAADLTYEEEQERIGQDGPVRPLPANDQQQEQVA